MTKDSDWDTIARALRELHRALIARTRGDYLREHQRGGDIAPGELLRLLTSDPYFAWLRGLSELIVDIDARADRRDSEAPFDPAAARATVEFLITPPAAAAAPHAFAQRYWPYVQDDPHVAMAHAAVKQALRQG